ncbi:SAF domain-containing protein [Nocardiopsis composta]|uniref:Flp pilus assembly protein CpaB n=1 Tax=Nocardiopsis composta TaxID=157465 RepID=A0A7W8QQ67_9ACTN|nr:SAF domain-containing protein [Nocardiopsis composta]MBB5434431.1 Flp pilus assembly protein CpaB [Nocardiopsis composta]
MPYRPALAVARHRGALGCACAALALAGALLVLRPAPEPVEQVLVAARDLSPRSPVGASDTAVRPIPRGAVPDGALPAESDPAGRSLTGPVRRGEVLTTARFADPPAADYGGGLVAVPVRIADAGAVALVEPGSRVDLLAAVPALDEGLVPGGPPPAQVVAEDRPVIAVPEPPGGALGGPPGALVVVAATAEEARGLAGYSQAGTVVLTIRG